MIFRIEEVESLVDQSGQWVLRILDQLALGQVENALRDIGEIIFDISRELPSRNVAHHASVELFLRFKDRLHHFH